MAGSEDDDDVAVDLTKSSSNRQKTKSVIAEDDSSSTDSDISEHLEAPTGDEEMTSISLDTDFGNVMRLQKQLQSLQRLLDHERRNKVSLDNKRQSLESQIAELTRKLETLNKEKFSLESTKIDLETKLRSLQYNLDVEVERRKNAEIVVIKTKEQLAHRENQCQLESDSKLKLELLIRSLQSQLDAKTEALNQVEGSQLLHDDDETVKKMKKSSGEDDDDDSDWSLTTKAEVNELAAVKNELEQRALQTDIEKKQLMDENKVLQQRVAELKKKLEIDDQVIAQKSTEYAVEIARLKAQNDEVLNSLGDAEQFRCQNEQLVDQLKISKTNLQEMHQKCTQLERLLEKERDEAARQAEQHIQQMKMVKDEGNKQVERLHETEKRLMQVQKELSVAGASQSVQNKQLSDAERRVEEQQVECTGLREQLHTEQQENASLRAKIETLQDKLNYLQTETTNLKQSAEAAQQAAADQSNQFLTLMTTLKDDNSQAVKELHEKNLDYEKKVEELFERAVTSEAQRDVLNRQLTELQAALDDTHSKLSAVTNSSEQSRLIVEHDRNDLQSRVDKLQHRLDETREKCTEMEFNSTQLSTRLEAAELAAAQYKLALESKQADLDLVLQHMSSNNGKLAQVVTDSQQQQETSKMDTNLAMPADHYYKSFGSIHQEPAVSSDEGATTVHRKHSKTVKKKRLSVSGSRPTERDNALLEKQIVLLKSQLRAATRHLKPEGSSHVSHSDDLEQLRKHAHHLMLELQQLRHLQKHPTNHTHLSGTKVNDDWKAELEARIRQQLNRRLAAINAFLQQHAEECEKIDRIHENNQSQIRKQLQLAEQELKAELSKFKPITDNVPSDVNLQSFHMSELVDETKPNNTDSGHQRTSTPRLETQDDSITVMSPVNHFTPVNTRPVCTPVNTHPVSDESFSVRPLPDGNLPTWLQKQLDRSIAKHLEKPPHLQIAPTYYSTGTSFLTTPSAGQTTFGYTSVLERNYLLV